jgi:cytochrome P450
MSSSSYDVMAPFHTSLAERDTALAQLRRDDPIHWDAANQWWVVTRHADVREISRSPELFSSEPRGPWHAFEQHFSMQAMDGERHRRHRNVVSRAFTPRLVSTLTERAEQYADDAIDALAGRHEAEFVTDLAVPVPLRIIADMLGVADGDLDQFREWSDAMIAAGDGHGEGGDMVETQRMMGDFLLYLTEAVERLRAKPGDDVLSWIIQAGDTGVLDDAQRLHRLEGDEVRDFALFLLVAGNETTRNGISQGMLALFHHPEEIARLQADESLWETAPDEILRWTSPVRAMRRVALRDTSLRDQKILEGQSVVMVYASANRDEDVFDEPHRFRVDRHPNEHLALGFGPHYCLGANLARMEIRVVLRKVLQRLPGIRLADGAEPLQTHSALIDGLDELRVEW